VPLFKHAASKIEPQGSEKRDKEAKPNRVPSNEEVRKEAERVYEKYRPVMRRLAQ